MQVGRQAALSSTRDRDLKGAHFMPPMGDQASPQAEMRASETFIRLLCQFEPEAVLEFLQGHEAYRVQVAVYALRPLNMRVILTLLLLARWSSDSMHKMC